MPEILTEQKPDDFSCTYAISCHLGDGTRREVLVSAKVVIPEGVARLILWAIHPETKKITDITVERFGTD